jgi:3-hydroxyisobutyrate dehydrogenase-like beta-hydroxyacid dehydrogenase
MGGAMAQRLLATGNKLIIHDLDPANLERLVKLGATAAGSNTAVADQAEVVFACLPSRKASLAAVQEIKAGGAIKVYIESSTLGRPTMEKIAETLAPTGIMLLDGPVSGGPTGAIEGTMSIMISGREEAVALARPALDDVAAQVFVVGDKPGLSQIFKITNNAIGLTNMMLSCEAVALGVKAGADASTLIDVINASTGRNNVTVERFPRHILTRTFDFGPPLKSAIKDFELYLEEAASQGMPAWSVINALQLLKQAVYQVGPDEDFTAFIKLMEKWSGVEVKGRDVK